MGQYNTPPNINDTLKDIKTRLQALEVGHPRLYSEVLAEQSTTSSGPVDLGGPSITIQVPVSSFVAVYAQADMEGSGGVGVTTDIFLEEVNGDFGANGILQNTGLYATVGTTPGFSNGGPPPVVGPLTFPASAGVRTYKMLYSVQPGDTGLFKNRKLWVWTLG